MLIMVKWIGDGCVCMWGGVRLSWMAGSIGDIGIRMLTRLLIMVKCIGDVVVAVILTRMIIHIFTHKIVVIGKYMNFKK